MKYLYLLILPLLLSSCDPSTLQQVLNNPLNPNDTANGLKEALNFGVDDAVNLLSAKDGYYKSVYKILLPEEARKVTDKLKFIPGFTNVEDVILQKINAAAEDAAKKAGPIFLNAIKGMSFNDAMGILTGQQNAATQYLHNATYNSLYGEFNPVILESLNKFNAQKYWADAVNKYNSIPLLDDVNPDLTDHVTTIALSGLFDLVEKKEAGIRTDISQRTTDLLRRVFAKQDN